MLYHAKTLHDNFCICDILLTSHYDYKYRKEVSESELNSTESSSIHPLLELLILNRGLREPIPVVTGWSRLPVNHTADTHTHTHTQGSDLLTFGLWEETRIPSGTGRTCTLRYRKSELEYGIQKGHIV